MHDLRRFFRENPQVLVLLLICLVLGLGTFFAVIFGLIAAGKNAHVTGEPSGALPRAPALVAQLRDRPSADRQRQWQRQRYRVSELRDAGPAHRSSRAPA